MQTFSYNPHPFLFKAFSSFFLFNNMLYCFSQNVLAYQHVLWFLQHVSLLFTMIYRFDVVGLAFLGQDMSKFSLLVCYAQIYMPICSFSCFCLDLLLYAQIYVFMCFVPCLCAQIYMLVCHVLIQPFGSSMSFFLVFWPLLVGCRSRSRGLGLHRYTQAYIKGLDHFLYECLCLFDFFHALNPLWAYANRSLGPLACVVASIPSMDCFDITTCEIHLRGVGVLALLALCHSFASLPTCSCMSLCRRPYSIPMELWILDPNLHLTSQDTLFCLITCLFALSYAQHALFAPVWLSLLVCSLHALPISFACLLACFFCLCMYTHGTWTLRARVRLSRCKQKGQGCKQEYVAHKGQCSIDQGAKPLLSGFLSLSLSLLTSSLEHVLGFPLSLYPLLLLLFTWAAFLWYDNVYFTSLPYVIALCTIYVCVCIYIYLCVCG